MFLTQEFEDKFRYGRYVLHVDMTFDNILNFSTMLEDDSFLEAEKVVVGLEMLLYDYEKIEDISHKDKFELFKYIMKEYLGNDLDAKQEQAESEEEQEEVPKQKTYDFNIDAERIYASFLMDYNLDLFKEQGKLHWKKFIALFSGLSEKTPFMQVVNIRTMEVPKETKYNKKDRQRIQKLQRQYALDKGDKNADDVFEDMIAAFGGKGR